MTTSFLKRLLALAGIAVLLAGCQRAVHPGTRQADTSGAGRPDSTRRDTFTHVDRREDIAPSAEGETRELAALVRREVDRYQTEKAALPRRLADLDQLTPSPDLAGVRGWRNDGWHRPFIYRVVGPHSYVLASAGPDGRPGTQDDLDLSADTASSLPEPVRAPRD